MIATTNPYLERLMMEVPREEDYSFRRGGFRSFTINGKTFRDNRAYYVQEYAWAIPNDEALTAIAKFTNSIVEIGAGTGYWAYLLSQYGVKVVAYDIAVPTIHNNKWDHKTLHFPVQHGDVLSVNQHQSKTLMLCWPPYHKPMSDAALKLYTGNKVIYIGEGDGGCTGTDEFHELLRTNFRCVKDIDIPNWDGIHDSVGLYERK